MPLPAVRPLINGHNLVHSRGTVARITFIIPCHDSRCTLEMISHAASYRNLALDLSPQGRLRRQASPSSVSSCSTTNNRSSAHRENNNEQPLALPRAMRTRYACVRCAFPRIIYAEDLRDAAAGGVVSPSSQRIVARTDHRRLREGTRVASACHLFRPRAPATTLSNSTR